MNQNRRHLINSEFISFNRFLFSVTWVPASALVLTMQYLFERECYTFGQNNGDLFSQDLHNKPKVKSGCSNYFCSSSSSSSFCFRHSNNNYYDSHDNDNYIGGGGNFMETHQSRPSPSIERSSGRPKRLTAETYWVLGGPYLPSMMALWSVDFCSMYGRYFPLSVITTRASPSLPIFLSTLQ